MQSIENKIYKRIYEKGKGWCFSHKDFSDLGSSDAIDQGLSRLHKTKKIRRICRGLYDFPKYSDFLKETLSPELDQAAQAIARKSSWKIQPEGNVALNVLGLSTQVPNKLSYLADGINRTKTYQIGNFQLEFRKAPLKDMNLKYYESALLVQALKTLGNSQITNDVIKKLYKKFLPSKKKQIIKDTSYVTRWIREAILKICSEETNG